MIDGEPICAILLDAAKPIMLPDETSVRVEDFAGRQYANLRFVGLDSDGRRKLSVGRVQAGNGRWEDFSTLVSDQQAASAIVRTYCRREEVVVFAPYSACCCQHVEVRCKHIEIQLNRLRWRSHAHCREPDIISL